MTGEELKKRLSAIDETLANIARKLDMTPQNLDGILKTKDIKTGFIEKLCIAYNKPISYFFDEPTDKPVMAGDHNQYNEHHAHDNYNGNADAVLSERVKSLEALVDEKNERISELKERIEELKR